jgi:hypothetical protein
MENEQKQEKLENVLEHFGGLRQGYNQIEPGTFAHIDEILKERQRKSGGTAWSDFHTADGHGFYLREDGGVDWVITRRNENPILRHINDEENSSYDQLVTKGYFCPSNEEAKLVRNAKDTVVIDMDKITLREEGSNTSTFGMNMFYDHVNGENGWSKPFNEEENKLRNRLGYTSEALKEFNYSQRKDEYIFIETMSPKYIVEKLKNSEHTSLWIPALLFQMDPLNSGAEITTDCGLMKGDVRGVIKDSVKKEIYEK